MWVCIPLHHQEFERQAVSLSTFISVDLRVYPFLLPTGWTWGRVYPCLQSTVWTQGCFLFLHQQFGHEGVPYIFPPHAVWMSTVVSRVHPFSTASFVDVFFSIVCNVDLQVSINISSSVYALPSYDAFKCQNPRQYGIRLYGTRINKNADAGSSPVPV